MVDEYDYCRIGSLEKILRILRNSDDDYCRIGSLETQTGPGKGL